MKTGVLILNYFSSGDTLDLYRSISAFPDLTIYVVDNSCDPEEAGALRRVIPEDELIVTGKNLGYAGGNNLGIRRLMEDGEIEAIALLNPDIRLTENIFPGLLNHLSADSRLAAVGPRLFVREKEGVIYSDGGCLIRTPSGYLKPVHRNSGVVANRTHPGDGLVTAGRSTGGKPEIDYVNGSFIVMRVSALREVGLLDETYFLYFEEVDWCMRAKEKGWGVSVQTGLSARQRISKKESSYNYYFFRGWFLFLNRFDRRGSGRLYLDQLKKIGWLLRSPGKPAPRRFAMALWRLGGITMGFFNL